MLQIALFITNSELGLKYTFSYTYSLSIKDAEIYTKAVCYKLVYQFAIYDIKLPVLINFFAAYQTFEITPTSHLIQTVTPICNLCSKARCYMMIYSRKQT